MPVFLMSKKGLRRKFPDYKFLGSSTKGLSDVVTTLVIILISLVAIGVVWVVIQNVIQKGSEQVELGRFLVNLKLRYIPTIIKKDKVTKKVSVMVMVMVMVMDKYGRAYPRIEAKSVDEMNENIDPDEISKII